MSILDKDYDENTKLSEFWRKVSYNEDVLDGRLNEIYSAVAENKTNTENLDSALQAVTKQAAANSSDIEDIKENKSDKTQYASVDEAGLIKLYSGTVNGAKVNRSGLVVYDDGSCVVNTKTERGITRDGTGQIGINPATQGEVNAGTEEYKPVTPATLKPTMEQTTANTTDISGLKTDVNNLSGTVIMHNNQIEDLQDITENIHFTDANEIVDGADVAGLFGTGVMGGFYGGVGTKHDQLGAAVGRDALLHERSAFGAAAGYHSYAQHGGAIGSLCGTSNGFAGGYGAYTAVTDTDGNKEYINAIQLGSGTNSETKSLQVYNYKLLNADGYIPGVRFMPYSQDEPIRVGTWIDGTPIWRYAFDINFADMDEGNIARIKLNLAFDYRDINLPVTSMNYIWCINTMAMLRSSDNPCIIDDGICNFSTGTWTFPSYVTADNLGNFGGIYGWLEFASPESNIIPYINMGIVSEPDYGIDPTDEEIEAILAQIGGTGNDDN